MPNSTATESEELESRINDLLAALSLDERIEMLSGHGFLAQIKDEGRYCATPHHVGGGNDRLGIPKLLFTDGPRGVCVGESTCFPVPMARGASFDPGLEERIGDAIGREIRAHGANLFGGVCINLLRHPAWGRAQETYGEDPYLLGEMGAALVRGVQRHNVIATVKHFAANSIENARFKVDVQVDERSLREVYLPHFKRCVDEGVAAVMSAYNQVNGAYCGHNAPLLQEILKTEWGFDGFVYSDFILGCHGADACAAGLDVEAPETIRFGPRLKAAVDSDVVSLERIDDATRRVLRSLFRMADARDPEAYSTESIACTEHVALAREAAEKSIVLLKNDGILPIRQADRVLVLGRDGGAPNLGDHGSSRVYPPHTVTPIDGLRACAPPECEIVFDSGEDPDQIRALASSADVVVVVAGFDHTQEGEFVPADNGEPGGSFFGIGGDRETLRLPDEDEALIRAAADANPNTVVALIAGSAVVIEPWIEAARGLLMLWYSGMEGGHALGDIVFGRRNPSGRLPFTVPVREEDLPYFDRDADSIVYDRWHGYTAFEKRGIQPRFAFGFGLAYTEFELSDLEFKTRSDPDQLEATLSVRNVGEMAGDAVVQLYAGPRPAGNEALKRLCGFARVTLDPGGETSVQIRTRIAELAIFDPEQHAWRLATEDWRIFVGQHSADEKMLEADLALPARTWTTRER